MNDKTFDNPVFVKDGQFIALEIACVADALDFLDEWPRNRRGPIYDTAKRACHRAHDGLVPVSVARDAFAGFARSVNILEDVSGVLPWMTAPNTGRGGIPV
ncbi:conserved hypothetical protein [Mesorhizobium metallidurans STM 2683]|uniref:DUF982 domain-containing protein n=1 Tax=Mesorhizobium metallidurans STM 2683 TaxID=1297569 RepID=M5F8Q8_9HYPH|nr:DUF982 domain-containing protein [Mesorhizobium metallidurans]CCV08286.1 conserved hypothetical protein [Mesorhizobium metallidurans STM 2683]